VEPARTAVTEAGAACAVVPRFGPRSAAQLTAALDAMLSATGLLGADPEGTLAGTQDDGPAVSCQVAASRAEAQVVYARMKAFGDCVRQGVARGTVASQAGIDACFAASAAAPAVTRIVARLDRRLASRCGKTSVATALPGRCAAGGAAGLGACVEGLAHCDVCAALAGGVRLGTACHRFTDGVATLYCGDRPTSSWSVARHWNEALLDAIRTDTPRPTVHARNLFHLAAAMWDAWRAFGGGGTAWLTDETHASTDPARDRDAAISFAAYRVLTARFVSGPAAVATQAALRAKMIALGYDPDYAVATGHGPAAVGNRIGTAMVAWGLTDGANEAGNYADPSYAAVNAPLAVAQPGTVMADPNRWQPLALDVIVTQNGIPLPGGVQGVIGVRWDQVTPFALVRPPGGGLYLDPGPPPQLGGAGDAGYKDGARAVLQFSSQLHPFDGAAIDISPGAFGNNPLGTNAGTGHAVNPATGQPYAPNVVARGDFLRVLAEFWADGPHSETPPGHWHVIANDVSDRLATHRIGGSGPDLDRLEWDVKLYLALGGATHDAAIVAWGLKKQYDSARPISMIRYMGGRGQSSDPLGPSYDPAGLPLVPGLIEVITPATTASGQRHEALAGHEGEIAVYAYPGPPATAGEGPFGARWIRAVSWVPYQKPTFVTPAFPGFVSGHSTFSRAAAEVMTRFTGSAFFPGGLMEFRARAHQYLTFEPGPETDVVLQWGTYYDAADQAGLSRIPGGIHVPADDFTGRVLGSQIGVGAYDRATALYAGTP
jgi:hypothetical protein